MRSLALLLMFVSVGSFAAGGNIGFGKIKGIKVGNSNGEDLKIFLESGYSHDQFSCNGVVFVTKSHLNDDRFNMIYSASMAAYMANKKVRFYSHTDNSCEATFVALQETVF